MKLVTPMMKILFSNDKEISLKAVPFINNKKMYPSGFQWGKQYTIKGTLDIYSKEKALGNEQAILFIEKETLSDLSFLKKRGCKAVIISHQRTYDVFNLNLFPKVFSLDEKDFWKIKQFVGKTAVISIDLSTFNMKKYEFFEVVFPKGVIDNFMIRSSLHSGFLYLKDLLKNYYVSREIPRFVAYYFRDQGHQQQYTFLDVNFAYKDYFVVLQFDTNYILSKKEFYRPFAEIHEMAHIFLYALGKPVFLFEEGLPTYFSYRFVLNEKYRNWRRLIAQKVIDEPEYPLLKLMEGFQQRKISDVYYQVSASFMDWLMNNFGLNVILAYYNKSDKKKELSYNLKVFSEIFQISFQEAENFWKKSLKEQIFEWHKQ